MRFPELEAKIDRLTELMTEMIGEMRKTNTTVKNTGKILKEANMITTKELYDGRRKIGKRYTLAITDGAKENK